MLIEGNHGRNIECRSHPDTQKFTKLKGYKYVHAMLIPSQIWPYNRRMSNIKRQDWRAHSSWPFCANSSKVWTRILIDPHRGRSTLEGMNKGNLTLGVIMTMIYAQQSNNEGAKPLSRSILQEEAVMRWLTQLLKDLHMEGVRVLFVRNIYGLFNRCTRSQLETDQEYP